jgi:hypothetical protein
VHEAVRQDKSEAERQDTNGDQHQRKERPISTAIRKRLGCREALIERSAGLGAGDG